VYATSHPLWVEIRALPAIIFSDHLGNKRGEGGGVDFACTPPRAVLCKFVQNEPRYRFLLDLGQLAKFLNRVFQNFDHRFPLLNAMASADTHIIPEGYAGMELSSIKRARPPRVEKDSPVHGSSSTSTELMSGS
jgi:hypothetical protein